MQMLKAQILVLFIAITFLHVSDHVASKVTGWPRLRRGHHRVPPKLRPLPRPLPPKPIVPSQPVHHGSRGGGTFNVKLLSDEQEYLDAHNAFRDKKAVPHLSWDPNLVKYAKSWAMARSQDCNYVHHSKGPYGENMMWEQYDEMSPRAIVNKWAAEENNWDHTKHECKCKPETGDCQCSHYVAMVWKTTHRVGCANVTCADEKGILVVCEYDPKGQFLGVNPLNPHK